MGYNSDKIIDIHNPSTTLRARNPIINSLPNKIINTNKFDFSKHLLLTDNHAPVDYLISKELEKLY